MKKNFLLLTLACLMGFGSAWGREITPKFVSYDGQTSGFKSTNFGGSDEKANYVQNLFDGKTCTKWCSTSDYKIYYKDKPVVMDAGNDVLLVAYHIYNAANTADWQNRRWTSWSFYGSNQTDTTSSNWTLMHDTTGVEMSTANNAKNTFIIPEENRQRFRYYKLVVHCSVDTVQQQASEFRLETDVLGTQIEAVVYQDGNKNGYTKIYDPAKMAGSDTVLSTSGRTSCDWVQLWENGPRWATFNVGATISDYGVLTEGAEPVKYNNYAEVAKYYNTANAGGLYAWNTPTKDGRKEEWYGYYELDSVDVATTLWGSNWKTPTYDQLDSLQTYTTWSWCDANNPYVEGCTLKGYKVSGVGEYAQYSIFLPLAGYHDYHLMPNIIDVSSNGYYWSSQGDVDNKNAYYMLLGSGAPSMDKRARKEGFSVRAVLADDSVAAKETTSDLVTLTLCANDSKTANVITCLKNSSVYITAKTDYHHYFVQWSDGNTDNPRIIELEKDTTLTAQFAPNKYTITTSVNKSSRGYTTGDTTAFYGDSVIIRAEAYYGYHFTRWNDSITDNPRTVVVTNDINYQAVFSVNKYQLTVSANGPGSVTGSGKFSYLSKDTIRATPEPYCYLVQWSDGSKDTLRVITLTQDSTIVAEFDKIRHGACGDNLTWDYKDGSIIISGTGAMYDYEQGTAPWMPLFKDSIDNLLINEGCTSIGNYAFYGLNNKNFKTLGLPNSVEKIGQYAFASCSYLRTIFLNDGLEEISGYAFANDERLLYITCYAEEAPLLDETAFANYDAYLYVPCDFKADYKIAKGWKKFNQENVSCFDAEDTNVTDDTVTVEPSETKAVFIWVINNQAANYALELTKDSVDFYVLTFNNQGQLVGLSAAPSRDRTMAEGQYATLTSSGFKFTVTGLLRSSLYKYKLSVVNNLGEKIKTYTGEFQTTGTTAMDEVESQKSKAESQKYLRDGVLLIERNGVRYNAQGQVVELQVTGNR